MSGTITLPDTISITPADEAPAVSIVSAAPGVTLPAGVPPYPLAADPAETWSLQAVNGVLTWVQYATPPGQGAMLLEDGGGVMVLEDNGGLMLMEIF